MKTVGYYNGEIKPVEELSVPALDRAVYFGDGVYDVVICRNRKPFTLDMHIDRFYNSCQALKINFSMSKSELAALLKQLIAMADDADTVVYWQASRGTAGRKHEFPAETVEPNLLIMITPWKMGDMKKALRLITVEDTRFLHCDIKTLNLIPNVMATQRAVEANCQEVVFHRGERVTECAHSSLFLFMDGKVVMPPLDEYILPGITRKVVAQLCATNGIICEERIFTLQEMMQADEILVASTTKHFAPVEEIDGIKVGGKDAALLERMQALFMEELNRQTV